MQMIMFVLNDPNQLDKVMEAWMDAGVSGITVLDSSGVHRIRQEDDPPTVLGFRLRSQTSTHGHNLLFSIADQETIQRVVPATEAIVGTFDTPNTGILFTMPVDQVWGMAKTPSAPTDEQKTA